MNPSEAAGGRSDRNKRMDVKNRNQMEYLTERTLIRDFIPYPRFLLDMNLTQTAKVLYALLLDRSKISRNNGWKNEKGYIYVIYPIMDLAQVLVKSHMTIKKALNELENAGLLERQKQGFSKVLEEEDISDERLLKDIAELYRDREAYILRMNESGLSDGVETIIRLIEEVISEKADKKAQA